jgi:hypothetical protein
VALAGAAAAWLLSRNDASVRAPAPESPRPGEAAKIRPGAGRVTTAPSASSRPDTRPPIPADVFRDGRPDPAFLRSYLEGRTPDEVRPDGTQVFHGMPFEVRQPDGTIRVVPVTLTVQPTDLEPLPPEPR